MRASWANFRERHLGRHMAGRRFAIGATGLVVLVAAVGLAVIAVRHTLAASYPVFDCTQFGHSGDGGGTLYDALLIAGSGDTIYFKCDGVITVPSTITTGITLTIDANGHNVTLDGADSVRVIQVNGPGNLTLKGMTIAHGSSAAGGGGIYLNGGALSLINSTLTANTAGGSSSGGGIYATNGTSIAITNSTVSGNSASGGQGGGIYVAGGPAGETVTVTGSTFSANTAGLGAGIGGDGQGYPVNVSISGSTFSGNTASSAGGGIYLYTGVSITISSSTFSNNTAPGGGGAVYNFVSTTITNSTFSGNSANNGQGGAVRAVQFLTVSNSTFSGNGAQVGGGVYTGFGTGNSSPISITGSTFNGNTTSGSGAGLYVDTTTNSAGTDLSLANDTFAGNTAGGQGGALYTVDSTVHGAIVNTTITSNSASGGGAGLFLATPLITVTNSIIAGNPAGLNCAGAPPTDGGNNLTDISGNTCNFSPANNDVLTASPGLGTLGSNGGPTQTIPLLVGSPAIDAAKAAVCASAPVSGVDQRGITRPQGAGCDIGAYEFVPLPTTTTLAISTNPSVYGQSVTFTANVSSGSGTPTGSVTFYDNGVSIGTASLDGSGNTAIATSSLAAGSHPITATYLGNNTYASSTSAVTTQVVNQASTTDTISANHNPSVYGQSVTFTITVAPVSPGSGTPTGTYTFYIDGKLVGGGSLSGGRGQYSTSTLSAGTHTLSSDYKGDSNFQASSGSGSQTVNPADTTTTLSSLPNPSVFGQSVTFTATVAVVSPGAGTPTGTVDFKEGATTVGSGTLSGNTATFSTSSLAAGSHGITATYNGDGSFNASSSTPVTQTVNQASTTLSASGDVNPSVVGQSVTIKASISVSAPGGGTSTGTVAFADGATSLGSAALSGGSASISVATLAAGSHTITATYGGDSNFAGSTASYTQTVNLASTTMTVAGNINPSVYGQTVVITATLSTTGGGTPTGSVTFSEGGSTLGAGTLSGGVASISISILGTGSHSITATYAGDSSFSGSSASYTQIVNQAGTTTSLSADHNPAVYGQSVTFTATVAPLATNAAPGALPAPGGGRAPGRRLTGGAPPTGTVTFSEGATILGTGTLSSGAATFGTSALGVGSHTITATYSGDGNYTASTSAGLAQVINKANTTTSLATNAAVMGTPNTWTSAANTPTWREGGVVLTGQDGRLYAVDGGVSNMGGAESIEAYDLTSDTWICSTTVTDAGCVAHPLAPMPYGTVGEAGALGQDGRIYMFGQPYTLHYVQVYDPTANHWTCSTDLASAKCSASTLTPLPTARGYAVAVTAPNGLIYVIGGRDGATQPIHVVEAYNPATDTWTCSVGDSSAGCSSSPLAPMPSARGEASAVLGPDGLIYVFGGSGSLTTVEAYNPATNTWTCSVGDTNPGCASSTLAPLPTGRYFASAVTAWDGLIYVLGGTVDNQHGYAVVEAYDPQANSWTTMPPLPTGRFALQAGLGADGRIYTVSGINSFGAVVNTVEVYTPGANHAHSFYGQNVTFTATVAPAAPGAGTPTGTVTFKDGATVLGTAPLSGGVATFSTSALAIGVHTITANYGGDANFNGSGPASNSLTVGKVMTATTLAASHNPSAYGQSVDFTATVAVASPGAGTPTGSVTFYDGETLLGTGALSGGQATFTTSALSLGSHTITAAYSGDANSFVSRTPTYAQTVAQATTATALAADVNPSVYGQTVTLTATITVVAPGSGSPSGVVIFTEGGITFASAAVTGGVAQITISTLSVGSHDIVATYSGDTNFAGSASSTYTQVVNKASTTVSVTSTRNPTLVSMSVTFTATVGAVSPGAGTPTGTVNFMDGATLLGSATLSGGQASFTTSALAAGSHVITAVYVGSLSYATSTSAPYTQVVKLATCAPLPPGPMPPLFFTPNICLPPLVAP
jgi:parallel beta-helix repeat protein/predicted outer membrane repeat protein